MTGRLWGIGVGPGDPDLLTLKAARLIGKLPVIAYPAPDPGESTARAIAAAVLEGRTEAPAEIVIRVPMRPGPEPAGIYDQGAAEIAAHLHAGRDVGVLCEGDPFFYGSFIYLHDRLAPRFACTIVPGVSSLTACAAASARALVRRDEVLTVVPATLPEAELEDRLTAADAAAILKVGRHLPKVKAVLDRLSLTAGSIYVAHASRAEERVLRLAEMRDTEAPYFSMILVSREAAP